MAGRKGRPKAGKGALDRERIIRAALALVDRDGLEALTMRRLAESLGVDPMALYHHLPGRRALVSAMIGKVFGSFEVRAPPRAGWKRKVKSFAAAYRAMALAHPNLVLELVADPGSASEAALAAGESLHAALLGSRLGPAGRIRAADVVVDYLHGYVLAERKGPLDTASARLEFRRRLAGEGEGGGRYPAMERTWAEAPPQDEEGGFEAGLEIILLGIEALRRRGERQG
jgi:AcrR family transcriptional regulator